MPGRTVLDAQQTHQGVDAVPEVEACASTRSPRAMAPVDQPLRRRSASGSLRDGLGASPRHRLLVVVTQLDQAVGVVHDVGYAVPPLVDDAVLVAEVRDVEVDDPRRPGHVTRIGREVEEGLSAVRPGRLGELPDLVHLEVTQRRVDQPAVRRGRLARSRQHLDVEVGVVVVPTGDRRTADEDHADVGVGLATLAQPGQPVVVPAQIGALLGHGRNLRLPMSGHQHVSVTMDPCRTASAPCFFDSRADVPTSTRPPLPARGFFMSQ